MGRIGCFPSVGDGGGISCMAAPSAVTGERKVPAEKKGNTGKKKGKKKRALTGGAEAQ